VAEGLEDGEGAIDRYEAVLKQIDPKNEEALEAIAQLQDIRGDSKGAAVMLMSGNSSNNGDESYGRTTNGAGT